LHGDVNRLSPELLYWQDKDPSKNPGKRIKRIKDESKDTTPQPRRNEIHEYYLRRILLDSETNGISSGSHGFFEWWTLWPTASSTCSPLLSLIRLATVYPWRPA